MASYSKYSTAKGDRWLIKLSLTDPITKKKVRTTRRGFKKLSEAKLAAQKLEAEEKKQSRNLKSHYFFKEIFLVRGRVLQTSKTLNCLSQVNRF